MCVPKRLILNDVGILLQNIRRIGSMTLRSVARKLESIMKLKRRSLMHQIRFMKNRVNYRRSVIKNRLKAIFDTCQRTATNTVTKWINARRPALQKRLSNPSIPRGRKRSIRAKFVRELRNKELRERIMAVLDARYVRTISTSYLRKYNTNIKARIEAARTVYFRFTGRTSRILRNFRSEVKFQINKDLTRLRAKATAYLDLVNKLDQQPAYNVEHLVNMTKLQKTYTKKEADVMSKFSWFNPSSLPYPQFNQTNEGRILNTAMTDIFSQVLNTRKERYANFKEKHNLLEFYNQIRAKLHRYDANFSKYVRDSNVLPMPLETKKYGYHYSSRGRRLRAIRTIQRLQRVHHRL